MMKVIDTLTDLDKGKAALGQKVGVFHYLNEGVSVPYGTLVPSMSRVYYFHHSGQKEVSKMYYEIETAMKNYPYTQANETPSRVISQIIRDKFTLKWTKIYESLTANYSVIQDIDVKETKKATNTDNTVYDTTNTDDFSEQTDLTVTVNTDQNDSVYGYNSLSAVPADKTVSTDTETTKGDFDKNKTHKTSAKTGTENKTFGIDEIYTKSGHNVPVQDLISKEIGVREKTIFFDIVFKDIDSVFTLQIY